jgi:hypothetical protein
VYFTVYGENYEERCSKINYILIVTSIYSLGQTKMHLLQMYFIQKRLSFLTNDIFEKQLTAIVFRFTQTIYVSHTKNP